MHATIRASLPPPCKGSLVHGGGCDSAQAEVRHIQDRVLEQALQQLSGQLRRGGGGNVCWKASAVGSQPGQGQGAVAQ